MFAAAARRPSRLAEPRLGPRPVGARRRHRQRPRRSADASTDDAHRAPTRPLVRAAAQGRRRLRLPRRRLPPEGARDRRRRPTTRARAASSPRARRLDPRDLGALHRRWARSPSRATTSAAACATAREARRARPAGRQALRRDRRRAGRARPLRRGAADAPADGRPQARTSPPTRACPTSASCTATSPGAIAAMRLAVSAGGGAPENVAYVQTLLGNLEFEAATSRRRARRYRAGARPLPGLRAGAAPGWRASRRRTATWARRSAATATPSRGCRCPSTWSRLGETELAAGRARRRAPRPRARRRRAAAARRRTA